MLLLAASVSLFALDAAATPVQFDIPAQQLADALRVFSTQSQISIVRPGNQDGDRPVPALTGRMEPEAALRQLLAGSRLQAHFLDPQTVVLENTISLPADITPFIVNTAPLRAPKPLDVEDITVTGTRIRGVAPVGSELVLLDREHILQSGRSNAAELIRTLPQNSGLGSSEEAARPSGPTVLNLGFGTGANLRGLGSDSTLVLLNGHRMAPSGQGQFVDISQIPVAAIERVEVVADGASAIYGSDAIGGVINFILRKEYEGVESSMRYDSGDGFHRVIGSGTLGSTWSGGHAMLSVEYYQQSALNATARDYFTNDLRRFGGPDLRLNFSAPGTIVANGTTYAIPDGQNGIGLAASKLVPGTSNLRSLYANADILPSQRRTSAIGSVAQEISDRIRLSLDGIFSRRTFNARLAGSVAAISVPSTNPFFVSPVPGATAVTVNYSFEDEFGPQTAVGVSNFISTNAGLQIDLGGSWKADVSAAYSGDIAKRHSDNALSAIRLVQAVADRNPATAFNAFGDGSSNNPATIDALRATSSLVFQRYRVSSFGVNLGGSLFELPGGKSRLVIGVDGRTEQFEYQLMSTTATPTPVVTTHTSNRRKVGAVYSEFLVPLVGANNILPFAQKVDISFAVRAERYDDFGYTTNPKVGVSWAPVDALVLRGSVGTSFKAPALQQTGGDRTVTTSMFTDPRSSTGRSAVIIRQGANSDLQPEKATIWSAGFDLTPLPSRATKISATLFSIDYKNRISNLGSSLASVLTQESIYSSVVSRSPTPADVAAFYADPDFAALGVKYPASQIAAIIDNRFVNIGSVKQRGIDVNLSYDIPHVSGVYTISGGATRLLKYDVKRTPTSSTADLRDDIGSPSKFRARAGLGWRLEDVGASAFINYSSGYRNTSISPAAHVNSWTTIDANLQIGNAESAFTRGFIVALSAQNLTDRAPPAVANVGGQAGYNPEYTNALGRVISLSVRRAF